ncbi:HAD family hydrolase, partial [Lactobacillus sp. XV13L]|nr:HAD family hydrolase [Lactobacillus sp. XV13L]
DLTCHNQVGQGLSAEYAGHFYQIGKPTSFKQAPSTFAKRCQRWSSQGKTVVYIACDYHVIGILAFMDLPKPSAQQAINYFNQQQIQTIMITGDSAATGQAVAQNLRIKQAITNVLPTQKAHVIAQLQQKQPVAMVGDGINDAPALANANIGVAMGSGTDVAIDVADVVLVKNDLSKLSFAHRLSTKMNQVVFENIILSLIVVLVLVVLNALQLTNIAWGVVLHEGSTLLVIFNGLRLLFMQR